MSESADILTLQHDLITAQREHIALLQSQCDAMREALIIMDALVENARQEFEAAIFGVAQPPTDTVN